LRARLSGAGREAARSKFSQGIVIERLTALYETLAARRPRAALMGRRVG
jgi:hypothetical protein